MAATVEASLPRPLSSRSVESVDSEYECGLMIEALKRELNAVRVRLSATCLVDVLYINNHFSQSQLAFLTHNLDVSLPCKQPVVECSSAPHSPTTRVTPKVKPVDKKVLQGT